MKISHSAKTRQLFRNLNTAILGSLFVPNELLPADYRSDKKTHRSLLAVAKQHRKANPTESEHDREKREKASRIENYRLQIDAGVESIEYDADEMRLYSAQVTFCGMMDLAEHRGIVNDENDE